MNKLFIGVADRFGYCLGAHPLVSCGTGEINGLWDQKFREESFIYE